MNRHRQGIPVMGRLAYLPAVIGLLVSIVTTFAIPRDVSAGDAFSADAFLHGALRLDLEAQCREVPGSNLSRTQLNRVKLALAADLDPLFFSTNPLPVRARVALYLKARQLYDRESKKQERFGRLLKLLGSQRRDDIVSALGELHALVLSTRDLRRARAELARIHVKNGRRELELIESEPDIDFVSLAAWVSIQAIDDARDRGVDCTGDPLYPFLRSLAAAPIPEPGLEHADLRNLDSTLLSFLEAWSQPPGMSPTPEFTSMMRVYSRVQENHGRALSVLGQALALYARYLSQVVIPPPARDIPISNDPHLTAQVKELGDDRASVSSHPSGADAAEGRIIERVASSVKEDAIDAGNTVAPDGVPPEEKGEDARKGSAETLEGNVGAGERGTPEPSLGKDARSDATDGPDERSVSGRAGQARPGVHVSGDELRAVVIADVLGQVRALREQKDASGSPMVVSPMGVALNLLSRLKRVAQIGDMLADDAATKAVKLAGGQIALRFSPSVSDLRELTLDVAEEVGDQVTVEWTMHLTRKDDSNFRIESEFNHIRGSVEIKGGEVLRAPNIHQLIVLMNRVDALMAANRPAGI